ncbi:MAG: LamG domain-containing protein [Phycisphaerae bacterium]
METKKGQAKWSFAILLLILVLSLACDGYGDSTAPRPSPAKWRVVPITLGTTSIKMASVAALDAGGDYPVAYYFECTNHGEANSTWQTDANYTATGLTPSTMYTFKAMARDSAGNMTTWTMYTRSATTDACSTPPVLRLDLNNTIDNNEPNTQVGFLPFSIATSGNEVNGITIDLGGNITSARRDDPCGAWDRYGGTPTLPGDPCYYSPRAGERIYRDFVYGVSPSGATVTLWGLGANRDCNIMIWAWDSNSTGGPNRVAKWYANGTYLFDANFTGDPPYQIRYDNQGTFSSDDFWKWAFKGRATSDSFGRIVLTSTRGPSSPADQPFAFVNALQVEPNAMISCCQVLYAHRPVPFDGTENVPVNTLLKWRNGEGVVKHDLYLDPNFNDVNTADRTSPVVDKDLNVDVNGTYDPYTALGFLKLDTTYYWRVDENTPPNMYEGEVWSFTTCPNSLVDNFNRQYGASPPNRLRDTWKDNLTQSSPVTRAQVLPKLDPNHGGPPYQSMEYWYRDNLSPYYSEARADIGTGAGKLNIDPDWLGMDAKALVLWFYGKPTNDANEKMYVKLTDGSSNVAQVLYDGDMNDIREPVWHEWNIDLQDFVEANNVNLTDVNKITIGFGDGAGRGQGTVYFEDIQLYATRCILSKRSADFAWVDYAPLDAYGNPGGDCAVDYQELAIMAEDWLEIWTPWWQQPPPPNLVVYWPMNEGDGNRVYPDPCNPLYTGTFSATGVSWVTPGQNDSNAALHFDGSQGGRVSCGNENPSEGTNAITLSVWVKWGGRRIWDHYLCSMSQGVISKRVGWDDATMMWMLQVDTNGTHGGFGLRQREDAVYSPNDLMMQYVGRWVHLAATFDGTTARLYFNGEEAASGPFSFSAGTDAGLTIGNSIDEVGWPDSPETFYGDIDEVRIYNRALDANEIAYLAQRKPLIDLYSAGLWWPVVIDFKDFAVLADQWLREELWPR